MPSPLVLINSNPQINGVNVTASSTVTIALASNAGVSNWNVICLGTDELNTPAAVNATLVVNHSSNTATFTAPGSGSAMIFQTQINNGIDINGVIQPNYTTTFGVYVLTGTSHRVGAQGETNEGSAAFGWITKLNPIIRAL
jgi:hypothetical protein